VEACAEAVDQYDRRRIARSAIADVKAYAGGDDEIVVPLDVLESKFGWIYFEATAAGAGAAKAG
jgi:hypothetical protein